MYSKSPPPKKKPINFNTNYRREMEFVPINVDYFLLKFDTLKFFLGVRLHGGPQPNFNFLNVNCLILKKIKLGKDPPPHVDALLRKISKH